MKTLLPVLFTAIALATCTSGGVKGYWGKHAPQISNIEAAREQFAEFAELTAVSSEKDVLLETDRLFDLLKQDEVAYYVYSEWMDGVFYSISSPFRNTALYSRAVERMTMDGVLSTDECEPFIRRKEWASINQKGDEAIIPGVVTKGVRSLILVVDLGCPSCRTTLLTFKDSYPDCRHIAVCLGHGPTPNVEGWDCIYPEHAEVVFDIRNTPVYFVVSPDGIVEEPYSTAL